MTKVRLRAEHIEKLKERLPELSFTSLVALQILLNEQIQERFAGEWLTTEHLEDLREECARWPSNLIRVTAERFEKLAHSDEVEAGEVRYEQVAAALFAELATRGEDWTP